MDVGVVKDAAVDQPTVLVNQTENVLRASVSKSHNLVLSSGWVTRVKSELASALQRPLRLIDLQLGAGLPSLEESRPGSCQSPWLRSALTTSSTDTWG